MRGKEHGDLGLVRGHRITPAYAGKSGPPLSLFVLSRDRPRVCVEKACVCGRAAVIRGSLPHMRGKVIVVEDGLPGLGITPAYAGKSRQGRSAPDRPRDHPRTCGEKAVLLMCSCHSRGSPPHMRGKVWCTVSAMVSYRITPRTCGEKVCYSLYVVFQLGSPPHMRGKGGLCCRSAPQARITLSLIHI